MRAKRSLVKKTLIATLVVVLALAGLAAVGVGLLDHFVPRYRQALVQHISARIDGHVTAGALSLHWSWSGPALTLDDVDIFRRGQSVPAVTLKSAALHFSYPNLIRGKRLPDGLTLDTPRLTVERAPDGRMRLRHWTRPEDPPLTLKKIEAVREHLTFLRIEHGQLRLLAPKLPAGQLTLTAISASVHNAENDHWQLTARASGPAWWPQATLHARLTGALTDLHDVRFDATAKGVAPLILAHVDDRLDSKTLAGLSGGAMGVTLQGRWHGRALRQARADITLNAIRRPNETKPLIPALKAHFNAVGGTRPGDIRFALDHISGAIQGLSRIQLTGQIDSDSRNLEIDARHLPAGLALRLARLRFPRLDNTHITAALDHLTLTAGIDQPLKLALDFAHLKVDNPRLAFGPIAGHYYQQGATHVLVFDDGGGTLAIKRYLKGKLAVTGLGGSLYWHRTRNGLHINAQNLSLASQQAHLSTSGSINVPASGPPVLDLHARMQAPHVKRLLQHIPQAPGLPNRRLRDWLPKAITSGAMDHAQLTVAGPLDRFPYAKPRAGEGFHLKISGHDVSVQYKPDWPALQDAAGTLTLSGETLDFALQHGRILDTTLAPSSGHVDDVREPVLHVDANVKDGRARQLLAFLTHSPLKHRFSKLLDAIDVRGVDDLSIRLRIPLKPGLGEIAVTGEVTAHDNSLRQQVLPGPITGISGKVTFDNHGLSAHELRGNLLGVPVRTELTPGSNGDQRIISHTTPELPADRDLLAHYLPARWLSYAHGTAPLRIGFEIAPNGHIKHFKITSDLKGMAIDLPAPLHKPAARSTPLTIRISPDASRVNAVYDNRLHLAARLDDGRATRVQAVLGAHGPTPPDRNGLWIGGRAKQVDGLGWFKVVRHVLYGSDTAANKTGPSDNNSALAFLGGDLRIGQLRFGQRYFQNPHIRAQPMHGIRGWRVNFEGANTQGQITWTNPDNGRMAIAGNLARLALQTNPQTGGSGEASTSPVLWPGISPLELPRLKLYVQDFSVDHTSFGHTRVNASALTNGWRLDAFSMTNGALTGTASAQWTRQSGKTEAMAQADFKGHGLSRLLRTLGYRSPIRARSVRMHSVLRIAPNPNGLDLRALDGNVHLAVDHGTLLSVDPGAGRLLGLFNLYVLPRRLRLDFRDVVDKGMAFDHIRADFNIRNGNAFSKDTRIQTPSSKISIRGRIGLAARDYDERVTITPKVGTGVALAGTLLGGPLVGVAVLGVQQLLKKPIQQFSSIEYTLKGSWDDPTIAEPSATN